VEKSIANPGRILFYHDASDSYIEEEVPWFDSMEQQKEWFDKFSECDQVTHNSHHEARFRDQKEIRELTEKMEKLIEENDKLRCLPADANARTLMNTELTNLLPPEFRSKFPMYQFFRECGPLEAFAVMQSQMMIANKNLKVWGVFLFEDEAKMAMRWLQENRAEGGFTYSVEPTRITRFQGF
jgi:hypothetical protein